MDTGIVACASGLLSESEGVTRCVFMLRIFKLNLLGLGHISAIERDWHRSYPIKGKSSTKKGGGVQGRRGVRSESVAIRR